MEVELSDLRSSENDQGVAAEVRSMVSIFLDKDSRDRCLDRIGRFADRFEFGDEPSDEEKKLIDNFTQLCFDVIRTSVGAHIWRPSADDAGKASPGPTGGVPPSPIQPRLLVP